MILYTGKLTKVSELEGAQIPNNRPVNEVAEGEFIKLPTTGEYFLIMKGMLKGLKTSMVIDIIDESTNQIVFKTLNSIYKLEYKIKENNG